MVAGELRCPAAAGGEGAGQDRGDRPHGPDAWCRVPGWRRQSDPPGDPVERPAHRGRMRRDRARGRPRAAAPDRGQPRAHRLPGAQGAVAAPQRAAKPTQGALAVAAQGFHPLSADRRARERCLRCRRHAAARPRGARLVGRDPCRARHPARLAAAGLRGPGGDRPGVGCGCRGDRPAGGPAGDRGRRRQCRRGGRLRRRARRHRLCLARHLGRRVRAERDARDRPERRSARVLPRRARPVSPDGRDPLGRRQPALVSRRDRRRAGGGRACPRHRSVRRADGGGGRDRARRRWPLLPALSRRRADAAHGPVRARRLARADARARPAPSGPRPARGRELRAQGFADPDAAARRVARCALCGRRRCPQRGLARHARERAGRAAAAPRGRGGAGARRGAARGGGGGRACRRRRGGRGGGAHAGEPDAPDAALQARYEELHGAFARLYPTLRQTGIWHGA